MREIVGPIVALLTPFDRRGQIDFAAFGAYLDYLSEKGVASVVTNGTTAEFPSLSLDERRKLLEYCRSNFDGSIINHVSSCCIADIRSVLSHSRGVSDFNLLLPPFYFAEPQTQGVRTFFEAVLASTDQPCFLYNFPQHTGFEISAALVHELADLYKNLVGIKDSSGILEAAVGFSKMRQPFSVYVGNDSLGYDVLAAGLAGSVTGAGSSFPECLVRIHECFFARAEGKAQQIQQLFNTWNAWRKEFSHDEIALTKQAVAVRLPGFPVNVRPPICPLSEQDVSKVASKVFEFEKELSSLFGKIGGGSN